MTAGRAALPGRLSELPQLRYSSVKRLTSQQQTSTLDSRLTSARFFFIRLSRPPLRLTAPE